jgi:hypothetical protein
LELGVGADWRVLDVEREHTVRADIDLVEFVVPTEDVEATYIGASADEPDSHFLSPFPKISSFMTFSSKFGSFLISANSSSVGSRRIAMHDAKYRYPSVFSISMCFIGVYLLKITHPPSVLKIPHAPSARLYEPML